MSTSQTQNLIRSTKLNIKNCNSLKYLTAIAYTLCQATFFMRTAIFLGLTAIADAIRKDWLTDKDVITFGAITLIVMMTMDIWEFIIKIHKTS